MGSVRFRFVRLIPWLAMLFIPMLASAQTASVTGTVEDKTGAVLVNATIKALNSATNTERTTATNETGEYRLVNLVPGVYIITFEKQGFRIARFENITLNVDQVLNVNATLDLTTVSTTVEVTGAAIAPVDTESATISNLVDQERMTELPLILRDPYQLVLLSPGIIQSNSGLGGFSANGTSERNNNFLLDGVDNNDTEVPGIAGGLNALNPDSTQEFRVITNNYGAEYGRNNGAIIDVVTKSGGNQFHGTAYEFGRYNALAARDFFNTKDQSQNHVVRNDFGASASGPIIRNKTFWFVNYEGQRFITTLENNSTVPTSAFRTGKFSFHDPLNPAAPPSQIDVSTATAPNNATGFGLDPNVQQILSTFYPLPNGPSVDDARGTLFFPSSSRSQADDFTVKIDQHIGSKHTLSGRYAYNRFADPNPFHTDTLPGNLGGVGTYQRTQNLGLDLSSSLTNNLLNDLRFGANRTHLGFNCAGISTFNGFGNLDTLGRGPDYNLPSIATFGCQPLGDTDAQLRFTGTYHLQESLTWVHGRHTVKWGGEYRRVYGNSFNDFSSRQGLSFSGFSDFGLASLQSSVTNPLPPGILSDTSLQNQVFGLLGVVDSQSESQFFNSKGTRTADDLRGFRQREWAAFAQDSWKVASNLTFNYGLRYEYYGVPFEVNNQLSNLFADPSGSAPFTFSNVGDGTGHSLYREDKLGFEPRLGIAWDPFKTGKTSIRAGYGIFRDRIFGNLFGNARGNPPFLSNFSASPFVQTNVLATPTTVPASPVVTNINPVTFTGGEIFPILFDPNLHNSYSQNWNFGIQRQLPGSLIVEVNYVGSKGNRIFRVVDGNPPQPGLVTALEAFCVPNNPANTFGCTAATLQFANLWLGKEFGALPFDATNNNAFETPFSTPGAALNKSIGNSTYHGLQVNVNRRLSNGFQIQGAYTYSHAISDVGDPLNPAAGNRSFPRNSFNLRAERGSSDFDIRHRFVVNYIYQPNFGRGRTHLNQGFVGRVLEGWELSGITEVQSGHPFDIFGNRDSQHTGLSDRAFLVGNPHQPSGADKTFTGPALSGFALTPVNQASNVGRNVFTGPGIVNFDGALLKDIAISERVKLQLRFEAYNIFNRTQFAQPGNAIQDPGTFGISTATLTQADGTTTARQLQIGARLVF